MTDSTPTPDPGTTYQDPETDDTSTDDPGPVEPVEHVEQHHDDDQSDPESEGGEE